MRWTLRDFGVSIRRKDGAAFAVDTSEARERVRAFSVALDVLKRSWLAVPSGLRRRIGDMTLTLHADGETVHDLEVERVTRNPPRA